MPSKKILAACIILIFCIVSFVVAIPKASSDQLDDINTQLSQLNDELNKSVSSTKPLQSQLESEQKQIANIKGQITQVEADIVLKKKQIDDGYTNLAQKTKMINQTIRDFYVKSYYDTPLLTFFSQANVSDITQTLAYQHAQTEQDKSIITNIALTITDLENKKVQLQQEEAWLTATKAKLDVDSAKLDKIVASAKEYQSQLSSQIAQLSAQQQQLIAQKQSSLNIPQSAYAGQGRSCVNDKNVDPGFSPALAFFSYGVPNRVGLNQYGAWGRAKAGESAEQILQDYYPGLTLKKDYDTGATINVQGYGSYNVDDYTKRIYEMPDSWTDNDNAALKAQAVASRSYGLAHRNGICTTESCQVFKPDPKGGNWDSAVEATKGWVLVDGSGNPVSTQYSSTHGGFIINIPKFDGPGGNPNNFADLNARAYDNMSPWFYCDWGARPEHNNTAWLTSAEVADIVNVISLAKIDGTLGEHFYQPDHPPAGKDVWNADRVKSELRSRGGTPFNSVSSISVSADFNSGKATTVNVSGDGGSVSFSASEFKDWFNLRAPANIQIVGPLYNVEMK
jgi:peptidoglycan hydrolase CwlO-like protein